MWDSFIYNWLVSSCCIISIIYYVIGGRCQMQFFFWWWNQRLFIVVVATKTSLFVLGDSFLQNHWMWSKTLIGWSLSEMLSHTNTSSIRRMMNILLFSTGIDVLNLISGFYKVALQQSLLLIALVGNKGNCNWSCECLFNWDAWSFFLIEAVLVYTNPNEIQL